VVTLCRCLLLSMDSFKGKAPIAWPVGADVAPYNFKRGRNSVQLDFPARLVIIPERQDRRKIRSPVSTANSRKLSYKHLIQNWFSWQPRGGVAPV